MQGRGGAFPRHFLVILFTCLHSWLTPPPQINRPPPTSSAFAQPRRTQIVQPTTCDPLSSCDACHQALHASLRHWIVAPMCPHLCCAICRHKVFILLIESSSSTWSSTRRSRCLTSELLTPSKPTTFKLEVSASVQLFLLTKPCH